MISIKKWLRTKFLVFFSFQENEVTNNAIPRAISNNGEHITDDHEITEFDHQPYVAFPEYNINRVCQ